MKTTIKAMDDFDALKAGHTYDVHAHGTTRLIVLTDVVSARIISLYSWQITDGLMRGKLSYTDSVQSVAMSCSAVAALCKKLDSGYAY